MGYIYDINSAHSDNKARIGIYVCHMINNILELFLSTFLIAHIYSFSNGINEYVWNVSIYEIVTYVSMYLVYHFASKIVSKTNRISVYRVSTLLWCTFVIFTIFYGQDLAKLIWLAGLLLGLARGFYWASYNVLKQEMIGKSKIRNFATYSKVIEKLIYIVFPVTLGALIETTTFANTAIIVLVLCLIQIAISFMIKSKIPVNSDYNLRDYLKRLKTNSPLNKRLKFLYLSAFVYGANTIVSVYIYISIMMQFGSNLSFGIITSLINVASLITAFLIGRFTKAGKRNYIYVLATMFTMLSVVLFIFLPSKETIIILNLAINVTGMIFKLLYDIYRNKFLKEYGRYDDIAEHQGIYEGVLAISRIFTYLILLAVNLIHSMIALDVMLFIFVALYCSNLFLIMIFEKKYIVKNEEVAL